MHDRVIKEDGEHYRVYRLLDKNNNILYIGKSIQMKQRIVNHLRGRSNIPKECQNKICRVEYLEFYNRCDMDIFELYAISYFKPPYNIEAKSNVGIFNMHMPKVWNELNLDTFEFIIRSNIIGRKIVDQKIEGIRFNKELFLDTRIKDFLVKNVDKKINNNQLNYLAEICKIGSNNIDTLNDCIAYNDSRYVLVNQNEDIFLRKNNRAKNKYGFFTKKKIKGHIYQAARFNIDYKSKWFYGKTKEELADKIEFYIQTI